MANLESNILLHHFGVRSKEISPIKIAEQIRRITSILMEAGPNPTYQKLSKTLHIYKIFASCFLLFESEVLPSFDLDDMAKSSLINFHISMLEILSHKIDWIELTGDKNGYNHFIKSFHIIDEIDSYNENAYNRPERNNKNDYHQIKWDLLDPNLSKLGFSILWTLNLLQGLKPPLNIRHINEYLIHQEVLNSITSENFDSVFLKIFSLSSERLKPD